MSSTSRLILGIAAGICTAGFVVVSAWLPLVLLLAAFTALITAACLIRTGRSMAVRCIGAVVFLSCMGYVVASWNTPKFNQSLRAMSVFGLPAAYVAIRKKYPTWGYHAAAFQEERD
jgi:hypothetical protein